MNVFDKIAAQQKGKENTPAWMVGEQLKDICRADDSCAGLVSADLDNPDMSLERAEEKIKAWADEHREKGASCVCVPPNVAEGILREFYGLPEAAAKAEPAAAPEKKPAGMLDLMDFL